MCAACLCPCIFLTRATPLGRSRFQKSEPPSTSEFPTELPTHTPSTLLQVGPGLGIRGSVKANLKSQIDRSGPPVRVGGTCQDQAEGTVQQKDPFDSRRERSPQTVTSKVSTGASKSLYQARPRAVAFPQKGWWYLPRPSPGPWRRDPARTPGERHPSPCMR